MLNSLPVQKRGEGVGGGEGEERVGVPVENVCGLVKLEMFEVEI